MNGHYIERTLEKALQRAAREFPAVMLTGPRQSGKTTLLRHLFGKTHKYVSLEPPDVRGAAAADPRGFIEMHGQPVIFDEVQYAVELLPYVKERIDADRHSKGQYLLTGSQNLLLSERVSESLAGRTAVLRLLPLTQREALGMPQQILPWQSAEKQQQHHGLSYAELWKAMLQGGYPELVSDPARDTTLWHASYIQTYLERDVRTLRQVGDLTLFQNFLRATAARSAQLLNTTELARDLGVAVNTVKAWLSVLEATFQIIVLRPYFRNLGKRLVKTPKVYFTDVGTLCYLTGLRDYEHAASGPMGGAIFETAVVAEIVKSILHQGEDPHVYFWRTSYGAEVDIVVEVAGALVPIEVKISSTPRSAMAAGIQVFRKVFGPQALGGYVVHPGDLRVPLAPDVVAWPFAQL